MNHSSLPARSSRLLPTIALSFALGFGLAWFLRAPEAAPGTVPAQLQAQTPPGAVVQGSFGDAWTMPGPAPGMPAAAVAAPINADVDALWARALAPGDRLHGGYDAEDQLRKLVQSDPAARRKLLARYDTAQTPQARELLKTTLSTVQTPDVIFFANRLANSSNPADRKIGFEMLHSLAPDAPETRALVRRTLATEQSPEILAGALATLQSGALDPEETAQMMAQLKGLSQHADPAVRSASIRQLGQWDKSGESEERLSQALGDSAPEVRQAAIFAIAQTSVRTPAAKAALLALVNDPSETRDVRGSALQVLERFALSKEEVAAIAPVRAQMRGM